MRFPDLVLSSIVSSRFLFLIGAPKCGTSSLFRYLVQHPCILGTNPKETYAFLEDQHPLARYRNGKGMDYLKSCASFPFESGSHANCGSQKFILEGTTHNLYSRSARDTIAGMPGSCKVVVMLRDPAKRIFSSFNYTKNNLARVKRDLTFARYVDLLLGHEKEEIQRFIRPSASRSLLPLELQHSMYSSYLGSWLNQFSEDQIRVEVSEEFFDNTLDSLNEIFGWLGLQNLKADQLDLSPKNETRTIGLPQIHLLAMHINKRFAGSQFRDALKRTYLAGQDLLSFRRGNSREDCDALQKLRQSLKPSVVDLENMLGKKILVWR